MNTVSPSSQIGSSIARFRKSKGLTQAELADKIGISRLLLSDYERGKVRVYADVIAKIADALSISADDILSLKKNKENSYMPTLRLVKRIQQIEKLPETSKKYILKTLDALLKTESE